MAGSSWSNQVQNQVIVGGANGGVFVYSGTPGANNLIASESGAADNSLDSYGNHTVQGVASYNFQTSVASFATALNGGVTTWYTATAGTFGPWTAIATAKTLSVAPTGLIISAGGELLLQNNGQTAQIFVGTATANNRIVLQGDALVSRSSTLSGRIPATAGDNSHFSTATTGNNQLTNQWSIPGGDGLVGTEYRLSAYGNVTMPGAALQAPHWSVQAFGSVIATVAVAAAALSAGVVYQWQLTARVMVSVTGTTGTILASTAGSLAAAGVNLIPGTTAQNAVALAGFNSGTTVNTTADTTISVTGGFAAGSAGQSLDCYASSFERLGT